MKYKKIIGIILAVILAGCFFGYPIYIYGIGIVLLGVIITLLFMGLIGLAIYLIIY